MNDAISPQELWVRASCTTIIVIGHGWDENWGCVLDFMKSLMIMIDGLVALFNDFRTNQNYLRHISHLVDF